MHNGTAVHALVKRSEWKLTHRNAQPSYACISDLNLASGSSLQVVHRVHWFTPETLFCGCTDEGTGRRFQWPLLPSILRFTPMAMEIKGVSSP